ncbi:MAG: hypothetical protein OXG35_19705 [Acidobacteria bacterium]|nr:hypothetical protein [Acidobacteriota bacterium]
MHDEIIHEVRANRERLAAEHDFDVRALYEAARQRERTSGRRIVKLAPRRVPSLAETAKTATERRR